MIHDTVPVTDASVAANPQLRGRTPLQVYDAVVAALTDAGFAVILNNHTNTTRWCCGVACNERWNASQSTAAGEDDWLFMARRYQDNRRVVGADLYVVRGAAVSSVLCATARTSLGTGGRTVWFDRGDNRPASAKGGDFAYGNYKGQCADGEYAAGIAFTGRVGSSRTPDALYCRSLT